MTPGAFDCDLVKEATNLYCEVENCWMMAQDFGANSGTGFIP